MSTNFAQPPPPSMPPPPSGPPPSGSGHGPFSEEEIQEIMAETGFSYEQVCQAIDQTGAQTKDQVYPNFYSGRGIEPQGAPPPETVAPGVVQGQPAAPDPEGMAPPPPMMPSEGGEASAEMPPAAPEGIDPRLAQAIHDELKPRGAKYRRMMK